MLLILLCAIATCILQISAQAENTCTVVVDSFGTTAENQGLKVDPGPFYASFGENPSSSIFSYATMKPKGVLTNDLETFTMGLGSVAVNLYLSYNAISGTGAGNYGVIRTSLPIIVQPGRSVVGRFSMAIPNPCTGPCLLVGGFAGVLDALYLGYNSSLSIPCVGYQRHGAVTIQKLTITSGGTGGTSVNLVVAGVSVDYTFTGVGALTTTQTAIQLATKLRTVTFPYAYYFQQLGATVVVTGQSTNEPVTTFSYTPGVSGSVAAWSSLSVARAKTETWACLGEFNGDPEVSTFLNMTNVNTYQITYGNAGSSSGRYMVLYLNKWYTIHTFSFAGNAMAPFSNPNMKLGYVSLRLSSGSTNYTVVAGNAMIGVAEGPSSRIYRPNYPTFSWSIDVTAVTAGAEKYVMSLFNNYAYWSQISAGLIQLQSVSISTDSTRGALVRFYRGCTVTGTPSYSYVDETQSFSSLDVVGTGCTGGLLVLTLSVGANAATFFNVEANNILVSRGNSLTVLTQLISGANAEVDVALNWLELF